MQHENIDFFTSDNSFSLSYREKTGHFSMSANHFHDAYEVYYLLSGERYYFIENRTFHVMAGDLVLINVHDLHKTIDAGVPKHQRILINFQEAFILTGNQSAKAVLEPIFAGNNNIVRLTADLRSHVESLMHKMMFEVKNQSTGYLVSLQALLMQLLVHVCRNMQHNTISNFDHPSPMHKKVSEMVEYINRNYMEPLTLSTMSELFYVSPYHLARIFKEATGFTFVEYLNSVRIREAQNLLRESRQKVIGISEKVGFGSIAHFGRVFKSVTGLAPLDYRKVHQT